MRQALLVLLLLAAPLPAGESGLEVRVSAPVELMSILFRLAGNPEYNQLASRSPYSAEVDKHFAAQRDHAVIARAKALRQARGVSYDAVMSMAVHLEYTDGRFAPRVPFEPRPPLLDERWTVEDANAFVELANDFAARAEFDRFFKAHKQFYAMAVARMQSKIAEHAVLDWYQHYFGGRREGQAVVTLGLLNGGGNYGISFRANSDAPMQGSPVIGVYRFDEQGDAVIGDDVIPMLAHEIGHAFVNPYVDRNAEPFMAAAEEIYPHRADVMLRQAYATARIMLYESIVRACTVRYVAEHQGAAAAAALAKSDEQRGFTWTADLARLLATYEADRRTYETLDAFTPKLTQFFAAQALALRAVPVVRSIEPANGATDVDPATTAITIRFDRPMLDKSWSVLKSDTVFPEITGAVSYDQKRQVLTVPVRLQPNTRYRFFLNSATATGFQSQDGVPLWPVELAFVTRDR